MPVTKAQYLQAFHDISIDAFQHTYLESDSRDFRILVRACWAFGKRGVDQREAAEIMLGEIFRASGRLYDPHAVKHFLLDAEIVDAVDISEKPPP